jgi:hypothetical protein
MHTIGSENAMTELGDEGDYNVVVDIVLFNKESTSNKESTPKMLLTSIPCFQQPSGNARLIRNKVNYQNRVPLTSTRRECKYVFPHHGTLIGLATRIHKKG